MRIRWNQIRLEVYGIRIGQGYCITLNLGTKTATCYDLNNTPLSIIYQYCSVARQCS